MKHQLLTLADVASTYGPFPMVSPVFIVPVSYDSRHSDGPPVPWRWQVLSHHRNLKYTVGFAWNLLLCYYILYPSGFHLTFILFFL